MVSTRGPEEEVEAYITVILGAIKAGSASGYQSNADTSHPANLKQIKYQSTETQ